MKFGIALPNYGANAGKRQILEIAKAAEELGYFSVWVADRLTVPEPPNQSWSKVNQAVYEPIVTLSFLSSVTERVKLGTSVLVLPFRNPLVMARQVTTLDILSGGRLILGVGVGWMEEEFQAAGVRMKERGARLDESIRLLRDLWEKPMPSFRGRFTEFTQIHFEPKPSQHRIPIWVGGNGVIALRRAAKLGDGWLPVGCMSFQEIGEKIEFLRKKANEYGRSKSEIEISSPYLHPYGQDGKSMKLIKKDIESYAKLGVSHFMPSFVHNTAEELIDQMKLFASEVIPCFNNH
jgi:probable F420-dependent oxidoreductase